MPRFRKPAPTGMRVKLSIQALKARHSKAQGESPGNQTSPERAAQIFSRKTCAALSGLIALPPWALFFGPVEAGLASLKPKPCGF